MIPIEDLWFTAPDGLKLHALAARPKDAKALPVICLPGISRTAEDFRELLQAFATNAENPRTAIALDSRGRGLSARDPNPANYSVPMEIGDLLAVLDAEKITRAVFVGTSRGGILTMVMGAVRPQAIAAAVLNDIGPVLDMKGLLRIQAYVGKMPRPASWADAAALLKRAMGDQFPAFDEAKWQDYARRTWVSGKDGLAPRSDPLISAALADIDPNVPPPDLWKQFEALAAAAPVLVLRGEHSDLLSRETVAAMRARKPALESIEIAGQGHAPFLVDAATIGPILAFAAKHGN
ncbi:MAG TPA: alpha/beta hydrolase [Xanthobacteraceae bacterium]|nr:alpha/beta hydrolase [Xanthobacteraceae bacterium]